MEELLNKLKKIFVDLYNQILEEKKEVPFNYDLIPKLIKK